MIWFAEQDAVSGVVVVGAVEGAKRSALAELPAPEDARAEPAIAVSPGRGRAAVLVEDRLWVVHADGGQPSERPRVEPGPSEDAWTPPVLVWGPDGPVAVRSFAGRRLLPLTGGWTLEVSGDVEVDGGFSGGHYSTTARFVERPSAQLRLTHGATVVDVPLRAEAGTTSTLMWPPLAGPSGVLLRWSVSRVGDGGDTETEAQSPLLISADGAVSVVPVDLGVSPLLALGDGDFLLPGASTLWRDDFDEPLHRLDAGGSTRPYLHAGRELWPSGLVATHAPAWSATDEQRDAKGDAVWTFKQARRDASPGALLLLLTDQELIDHLNDPVRWLAFHVPIDDEEPVRLIASGTHSAAAQVAVAV